MFFSRRTLARISSALFALLIAVVVLPLATASPASAAPADTIHSLVNQARWGAGQRGLIRNSAMDTVALNWAKQMVVNNTLSHNPNYSTQIPSGWNKAGENVAQGHSAAQAMHDGWMASSPHRANILGSFTDIGIAFYESGGTTWGVQVFANYAGHTGPGTPAPAPAPDPASAPAPGPKTEPSKASDPSATATPVASASADAAQGTTNTPTPTASAGGSSDTDSRSPSSMSPEELQASLYGDKPDQAWIAGVFFGGIVLLGGVGWFVVWRRRALP